MCANLPFDSWRLRHNTIQATLESIINESGVIANAEAYGLFSHLIPSAATSVGGDLQSTKDRQGLIPDFHITFPAEHGEASNNLAELKCISAGIVTKPEQLTQNTTVSQLGMSVPWSRDYEDLVTSSVLWRASMEIYLKTFMIYSRNSLPQKLSTSLCSRVAQSPTQSKDSFSIILEGEYPFPSSQLSLVVSSHDSTTWPLQPKRLPKNEPSPNIGSKSRRMIGSTTLKPMLRAVAFMTLASYIHEQQKYKLRATRY